MSDKTIPFVITDRRKFNAEGESRPDADPSPEREPRPETIAAPPPLHTDANTLHEVPKAPVEGAPTLEPLAEQAAEAADEELPPGPTAEQMEQSRLAFNATAERLDTAVRAANPGADHPPALTFDALVQSVYMQAILQLGGGTQEGQQPQVDILGARQSIDMLGLLLERTAGNLAPAEETLLSSAVFELRLGFLEITQALARSAQQRSTQPPPPGGAPPIPGGPRIVR